MPQTLFAAHQAASNYIVPSYYYDYNGIHSYGQQQLHLCSSPASLQVLSASNEVTA